MEFALRQVSKFARFVAYTFPSQRRAADAFPKGGRGQPDRDAPAYGRICFVSAIIRMIPRGMTIFWFNFNFAGTSVKHGMLIKSFRGSESKIDTATWTAVTGL